MNATSGFYRTAYRIGFHPWEDAEHEPDFVATISTLFDREEEGRQPPYGRALDVGTGSGIWGVELARRGWEVTGIDAVETALRRARRRVDDAEVEMALVHGDVTDLAATGVGRGFRLVLDTGTFHGLTPAQRRAMGREVDTVATADATVLLLVWQPKRRGPLPRGASAEEVEACLPGWKVTDVLPSHFKAPAPVERLLTPDEHWYRLCRE
jgi:SAM-dependent methyltransferase